MIGVSRSEVACYFDVVDVEYSIQNTREYVNR